MRIQGVLATVVAVAVAGCASSGPKGSSVMTASLKPNTARLVMYRSSPLGFAVQPSYMIDGKAVAPSQPNGFVVCDLRPGPHVISVGNASLNINLGGGSDTASLNLPSGKTTYLLAQPQLGLTIGVITLSNVTEAQGRSDTANLHKIEGSCPA